MLFTEVFALKEEQKFKKVKQKIYYIYIFYRLFDIL